MINRRNRFQGYSSLGFVFRKGETVRGTLLSLRYVANSRNKTYRVAVVVSRKVHKSAIVRNRIRRRIYEIVRSHAATIDQPFDLVFIVYGDQLAEMPAAQVREIVTEELLKAGIISRKV